MVVRPFTSFLFSLSILGLSACGTGPGEPNKAVLPNTPIKDTLIEYAIDGLSLEGGIARVNYHEGEIEKAVLRLFGEHGQTRIEYRFWPEIIQVKKQEFAYPNGIEEVHNDSDMELLHELNYSIDSNGKYTLPGMHIDTAAFKALKEAVPFDLDE